MSEFLAASYYGNTGNQWLIALSYMGLSILGGLLFYWAFGRGVRFFTRKTETKIDDIIVDMLEEPIAALIICLGIYYSLNLLTLPRTITIWIETGSQFFWPILLIWLIFQLYGAFHKEYAVSIVYLLMSRAVFFLIFFVVAFILIRYWIIQPTFCYPNCMATSLTGRDMSGLDLSQANFVEANLRGSNLSGVNLTEADLSAADLTDVSLREANLRNAKLSGANLHRVDLREANLSNTQLNGANLSEVDLTRTDLTHVELNGAVIERAKLVQVNLADRDLSGVDLSRADLAGANLDRANLSGASLSGADLSGASLKEANLSGAWLNLTNLTGVDLTGANLSGASLIGSNLASANLNQSRLDGATLIGSDLNGANLRSADLAGFRLFEVEQRSTDLLLDPILAELNEFQVSQVIKDGNLSGIQTNNQTVWPPTKIAILSNILGRELPNVRINPEIEAEGEETVEVEDEEIAEGEEAIEDEAIVPQDTVNIGQVSLPIVDPRRVRGDVYIAGSTTVAPLSQAIIDEFIKLGYRDEISLGSVGSGEGIRLFCQTGETDIAMASRAITFDEIEICAQTNRVPIEFPVGVDALVVVVNPLNNFIVDATLGELQLIFTAQNWSDVNSNWPNVPISRVIVDQGGGTFSFFVDEVFDGETQLLLTAPNTQFVESSADVVEGIKLTPESVGFLPFATYQENTESLKFLSIEDVEPNAGTVGTGEYALIRPLLLYSDAGVIQEKRQVGQFISFYLTNASFFIEVAGDFPASPAAIDEAETQLLNIIRR